MNAAMKSALIASGVAVPAELLLGLMFVVALLGGYLANVARAPRILGYLIGGVSLKYAVVWWSLGRSASSWAEAVHAAGEAVRGFALLSDLALGTVLFLLGSAFEARRLRSHWKELNVLSVAESGLTFALVAVAVLLCGVLTGMSIAVAGPLALLLGAAATATAPATTLLVLEEYEAKGPTSDAILTLTGMNCGGSILVFHILFALLAAFGVVAAGGATAAPIGVVLLVTTVGSVAVGLAVGVVMSWVCSVRPAGETLLFFVAIVLTLGAGATTMRDAWGVSYSFLLASLVAGLVFANVAINPARFNAGIRHVGSPLFAVFFVLAGYQLHLEMLVKIGLIGTVYAVTRAAGKIAGGRLGVRAVGNVATSNPWIGAGLLAQAGVAIGLAGFMTASASGSASHTAREIATAFYAVILGSVAAFELVGPLATKWIAVRCGEVKAVHLIRRVGPTEGAPRSMLRTLVRSLLRAFVGGGGTRAGGGALAVEHIMRTSVHCLPAGASFAEVLHFVERSRLTDFPVVDDNNELVGVIHFSDIREMTYDPATSDLITAIDLADVSTPAVTPDRPLTELREVFQRADASALPVVDSLETRLVLAIVEQRDLLQALHRESTRRVED